MTVQIPIGTSVNSKVEPTLVGSRWVVWADCLSNQLTVEGNRFPVCWDDLDVFSRHRPLVRVQEYLHPL